MSSDNRRRASKAEVRSVSHVIDSQENHAQKGAQHERNASISSKKQSEERAREEISSLMNLIKSNINANPKYKHLSAEDNGALQSIMSKLEGSIGMTNQNKNSFDTEKDKPSVPGQSQERSSETALIAEAKAQEQNNACDGMMNSDNAQEQKQPFNAIMPSQIGDSYQA